MSELLRSRIEHLSYSEIASIDPLGMDGIMAYLPEFNEQGEADVIRVATRQALYEAEKLLAPSLAQALAAIRDLDFLASSLLKHGENPLESIPGLEAQLIRLGNIANTVPRGTVFTYAAANPTGTRRRSFTGSQEEEVFIDSVARSIYALDSAVDGVSQVALEDEGQLTQALKTSSKAMDEMIDSIVQVRRTVSPEFFSFQMRPYFGSLEIGGKTLTGSGGAQMQLVAIDRMLWGCEDDTPDYNGFFEENIIYLTPAQQEALSKYMQVNGNKSIVGWLHDNPGEFPEATAATLELLKKVKKFRYPHRRIAQDNFKMRPSDAVGSGSYTPDILDVLIGKTETSILILEEIAYGA